MRLKQNMYFAVLREACSGERRSNFGWVMTVVVDDSDAALNTADREAAVDAAERRKAADESCSMGISNSRQTPKAAVAFRTL